jgi:transketolase
VLRFDPARPRWEERDRFIVSKGHGSISLYPILADLGFFPREALEQIGQRGSFLGGIPDPIIPGYETVNGSLGHGPGVACGMALALKRKGSPCRVFVMVGDGELHEGAVWEAVMFAGHHRLDNLVLIVDDNTRCMLNFSRNVISLDPLDRKFREFRWHAEDVDGHDVGLVREALLRLRAGAAAGRPAALIAHTAKGRGVPSLESDPIAHVKTLAPDEVDRLTGGAA